MKESTSPSKKSKILADHKRVGKRLIPPFIANMPGLSEVSWVDEIIPELIWIAALLDKHGFADGVALAAALAAAAKQSYASRGIEWFGWLSSYLKLGDMQKPDVLATLADAGNLIALEQAFIPLTSYYPECPLSFLCSHRLLNTSQHELELEHFKDMLINLFDRHSLLATRVQSTLIYLAFIGDVLKVARGTALADFPEVENYPNTDRSKQVAASVRASINSIYGHDPKLRESGWSSYFWNRGLELGPCLVPATPEDSGNVGD